MEEEPKEKAKRSCRQASHAATLPAQVWLCCSPPRTSGDELKMAFVGLALLGVVVGAAGTEILRAKKPELVEKIEEGAKRFVDRFLPSTPAEEETGDEQKELPC